MDAEEREKIKKEVYEYVNTYTVNISDAQRNFFLDKLETASDRQLIECKKVLKQNKEKKSYTYFFKGAQDL